MEITDFKLNDEQQKAVEILDGPVLVIAGAGSGKTRVLTARICNLIKNGISPYNILAITFTNKAAGEMKERISLIGDYDIWASTFHSMCAKILRMDIDKIGYSRDFTIYTEIETARTISRILKAESIDEDEDKEEKKNILWCISDAKNKFLDPDEYYKLIKDVYTNSRHICKVYKEYEEELKRSNALDFDDLICKTIKLFNECPAVLDKYASRFKYIHVDEFQDTNDVQYQLVKLLSSKYKNLFVVGDEDQSIYGWRGSNIRNILDFPKDFPGTEVVKLEKNYRSTKGILTAANNVIANNKDRNIKNLWTDKEDVSSIEIYEARDDREESAKIVRAIDILHKSGEPYNEMAILVRNNSLSRQFEEELNIYNIPYIIIGGMKFYERKEIKDFLAYVRLAVNPFDNDSFLRATAFPSRKIGDKSRVEIALLSKELGMSIFNVLTTYDLSKDEEHKSLIKKFSPIVDIIKDLMDKLNTMDIPSYLKYVLKKSGIEDALLVDRKKDLENRYDNVCELITAAENYQKENKDSLVFDFLESTALIADTDDLSSDDKVTIATVHAVKGLEYNNVFIAACEDEIFPSYFSKIENTIEEERRLMYVAITRAKTRLMVTYTRQRFRFGQIRPSLKSPFVDEMGVRYSRSRLQPQSYNQSTIAKPEYTSDFQKGIDAMIKQGLAQKNLNENVQKARNEMSNFKVGSLVEHKKFGLGKVLNVENTQNDVKLSIQFPQLGIKTFALSIAINLIKLVQGPDDF